MKYCSNCGSPLRENEKFCHSCGAKVEQQMVPPQMETPQAPGRQQMGTPQATSQQMGASQATIPQMGVPNGAPPPPAAPNMQTPPPPPPVGGGYPSGAAPSPKPYQAPPKKNSTGKIVGRILLALLPLAIGVGGYSLWYNLGKKATEHALEPTTRQLSKKKPATTEKKGTKMEAEPKAAKEESIKAKSEKEEPAETTVQKAEPAKAVPQQTVKSEARQQTPSIPQPRQQGMPMGYTDEEIRCMQGRQTTTRTTTQPQPRRRRSAEQIISSFGPNTDASARARLRRMKAQGTITTEEYNDCMRYIERRRHAGQ